MEPSQTDPPQNATESLPPQQERAVELLLTGLTVTAVAKSIGVSRETIHRWQREDWQFVAAMNRGRREAHEAATARLLSVWGKAAENLANAVEGGDLKASLVVLRGVGVLEGQPPPAGIEDPRRLAENAEIAETETRTFDALRRMMAGR